MGRSLILGIIFVGSLANPAIASAADDAWAKQVRNYMDKAAKPFFDRGYHYGGFSQMGSLNEGTDPAVDGFTRRGNAVPADGWL